MKKYFVFVVLILSLFLVGCDEYLQQASQNTYEQPVLYWKDINVVVVSNTKSQWFAKTPRYNQTITVKSEEYGLEETFKLSGSGVFMNMPFWNCKEGDIIKAELYSWKKESTGEITRREINRLIERVD